MSELKIQYEQVVSGTNRTLQYFDFLAQTLEQMIAMQDCDKNTLFKLMSDTASHKEARSKLHSLLISKLPEKKKGFYTCYNPQHGAIMSASEVEDRKFNEGRCTCGWDVKLELPLINEGYNSAISDVKAVLDEMFRSGDGR